jgi:F-type H+-transporting ATPase subunit b
MPESRNFLMPDATFAIEMFAFLVVLVVMTRWILPSIRAAMQARQLAITEGMQAARDAEASRQAAQAEAAEVLAAARRTARQIKEQAWSMREHLVTEGKRAGTEEYRWLAGRAERERERHAELVQRRWRQHARTAATVAARTYLGHEIDVERIHALVDEQFDAGDTATSRASRSGSAVGV